MNCAIVLAAGMSQRMGQQKMLLPFGGATVIERIVDEIARSAIEKIFVVVGYEGARVAAALAGRPATIVFNPDFATGMLSSVRCGLRALPEGCGAALVALGDHVRISAALIDDMLRARAHSGKGIVVPVAGGARGHPLLFAAGYVPEVLGNYDAVGLRGLLAAHPDDVLELPAPSGSVLADMDTPEDYAREQDALGLS